MSMQRCDALGTCAKNCGDCCVRSANASFAPSAAKAVAKLRRVQVRLAREITQLYSGNTRTTSFAALVAKAAKIPVALD